MEAKHAGKNIMLLWQAAKETHH